MKFMHAILLKKVNVPKSCKKLTMIDLNCGLPHKTKPKANWGALKSMCAL